MMRHFRALFLIAAFAILGGWSVSAAPPFSSAGVENEVREFTIEIDGKACGQYIMTITKQETGILSMRGQADITFKHFFGKYIYTYEGTEHWKEGRLLQMSSKCNDDGTKTEVSAAADHDTLRLKVNGIERNCRGDVWTTSYWKLADAKFHNQAVPLLDADTAKEFSGQLTYIGPPETLVIGGQQQKCYHFRVTGGPISPNDLWYDGQHRLVRQEFTDQGRRVVFVLRALRRD